VDFCPIPLYHIDISSKFFDINGMRSTSLKDYSRYAKSKPRTNKRGESSASNFFSFLKSFSGKKSTRSKSNQLKKQEDISKYKETFLIKSWKNITNFIPKFLIFCGYILALPFMIIGKALTEIYKHFLKREITRPLIAKCVVLITFGVIIINFAKLQVLPYTGENPNPIVNGNIEQIVQSERGHIYIQDIEKNKTDIALTSTDTRYTVFINPSALKTQTDPGKQTKFTKEEAASRLAGSINMPYSEVLKIFDDELGKKDLLSYVPIKKYVDTTTKRAVEYLINPPQNKLLSEKDPNRVIPFSFWLGIDTVQLRSYPMDTMLSNITGFVPNQQVARSELKGECLQVAKENEKRETQWKQYSVGYYGMEQKFCKELSGLNGKKVFNKDKGLQREIANKAINGDSFYLTIDKNLQAKAEEVLAQAMRKNTSKLGAPTNGFVGVMEVKTGKILAMAEAPTFNPNTNRYIFNNQFDNPFINVSGKDYEVGSVMKPLTVAAALNEYRTGQVDENGNRKGVNTEWKGGGYGRGGKTYIEKKKDGTILQTRVIQNADEYPYDEPQSLSDILRDSINTGIAELVPTIGNETLKSYIIEKYKFGEQTQTNLPGEEEANLRELKDEKNLYCEFCFANYGFGQGFAVSPLQLMRAYTPLANGGKVVEPYLYEKIVDENNVTIDDGSGENSIIKRKAPEQVLDPTVARDVTNYMINTTTQGYHGAVSTALNLDGYTLAGKTGTSQIGNIAKYTGECPGSQWYACNTVKGLYEHTYVGYGPGTDPQYIILIKLSEPRPGDGAKNFAVTTLKDPIKDMAQYTFEYMKLPKDKR
jgi:cell division protein FtsI/penicillin-binding protein 2